MIATLGLGYLACIYVVSQIGPGHADYHFEMINGFDLVRSSTRSRSASDHRRIIIDSDVQRLAWTKRFIFAERFGPRIPSNATSPQGPDFLDFWIVDTIQRKAFGPLSDEAFERKAIEITGRRPPQLHLTENYGRDGKQLRIPLSQPID